MQFSFDFQYDQRHRLEILRMRDQEERELKKAGNKRWREIAEVHYRERLLDLERKERETEMAGRKQLELNRQKIKEAAKKADEPVDDGKLVDAIFDFLPDSGSEAPAPSAFRVISSFCFPRAAVRHALPALLNANRIYRLHGEMPMRNCWPCRSVASSTARTCLSTGSRSSPQLISRAMPRISIQGNR